MTIYNPRADFKDEFDGLKREQIHEQVKDLNPRTHFTHNGSANKGERGFKVKTVIDFFFFSEEKQQNPL